MPETRKRRAAWRHLTFTGVAVTLFMTAVPASAHEGHDATPRTKPTIVLVHGAWEDGSAWAAVTSRLQHKGYTVLAAPNPLRGLKEDADYLAAFVARRTTGPVVLVGHSYGGAVVTNAAGADPDVKSIVYVDAFAPDAGETLLGIQGDSGDPAALFDQVTYPGAPEGDADLYIKSAVFPAVFANDLPAATARRLAATQRPIALKALLEPSGPPAWKTIPSWYVLGTNDNILAPSLQLSMAKRAHSHIVEVAASHLSMISEPDAVTDVVVRASR